MLLKKGTATHSSILAWRIPMDRGAWQATIHRVTKSQTRLKCLSTHACTHTKCYVKPQIPTFNHIFNLQKGQFHTVQTRTLGKPKFN